MLLTYLVKESFAFMESEHLLLDHQWTDLEPVWIQSIPLHPFFKICFSIFPSVVWSLKWFHSLKFSDQSYISLSFLLCVLHAIWLDITLIWSEEDKLWVPYCISVLSPCSSINLPSTLFSNTLHRVRDHISYPHKTAGKISFLRLLGTV